jgi:hypothetical protein
MGVEVMLKKGIYEYPAAEAGWQYLRVVDFNEVLVWAKFLEPKIHWRPNILAEIKRPYFEARYIPLEEILKDKK